MSDDILVQNAQLREVLRRTSPHMLRRIATATVPGFGTTVRQKLMNVGLLTDLWLNVRLTVSLATGSGATYAFSRKRQFAAVPRVRVQDFDGTDRIIASAYQLAVNDLVRRGVDYLTRVASTDGTSSNIVAEGSLAHPGGGVATGSQTLDFWVHVPIAMNSKAGDLRGMILAQTGVGELYVVLDFASALFGTGDDFVYNASGGSGHAVTFTSGTVDVYQQFYLPQQVEGVVPIPPLDIITVYELNGGMITTDNIAQNQEKLISLPNARQIFGLYYNYLSNSVFSGMDIHRLIANGNAILREYATGTAKEIEERWAVGRDTPRGVYWMDFAVAPIQTNLFGNIQLGLTPTSAPTSPRIEVMFESIYVKGAALSGLSQAG